MQGVDDIEKERQKIVDRIKHENELINHRMTWLGAFHGLLFASVYLSLDKPILKFLIYIACFVGVFISVSIGYAIHRANVGIDRASKEWDRIKPKSWFGLDVEGYRSNDGIAWLMPGNFIPWVFMFSWVLILFILMNQGCVDILDCRSN